MGAPDHTDILHATSVSLSGAAVLIRGASGSGKSALALEMLAQGAELVADDRVALRMHEGAVMLSAPRAISGLIEARGIGVLKLTPVGEARLAVVVDLDHIETERLPPHRETVIAGVTVPLLYKVEAAYFAPALMLYLRQGRYA